MKFKIITVYDSPYDYPNEFVAREFFVSDKGVSHGEIIIKSKYIEEIRNYLSNNLNLFLIKRQENDSPSIIESWI
jgi:hypothetical protein